MKKILALITGLVLSAIIYAQNLDTVQVSLTLPAQGWAWLVGKYGHGNDSTDKSEIRNIRTQLLAQSPATWTTNATCTSVSGRLIIAFYSFYANCGFQEVQNMGSTNAERTAIYNNIRAISNSAVQYYIGVIDGGLSSQFINTRRNGKEILLDN